MLNNLLIKNVVLISSLDLDFENGLSVLTGETGAGKSILLDSLGLAIGARGSSFLVRQGQDKLSVTASFDIDKNHICRKICKENDIDLDDELILKRIIKKDGKSKAYINDELVSIKLLKSIGQTLVEIHGQFETYGLLNPVTHINLLDDYKHLSKEKKICQENYLSWQEKIKIREKAQKDLFQSQKDEDFLLHSLDEIKKINPIKGEEEELASKRLLLMNSEKIIEGLNLAYGELTANNDIDSALRKTQSYLDKINETLDNSLSSVIDALERASIEIQEATAQIESISSECNLDPRELENIEERLFALKAIARKHNVEVDKLPDFMEELENQIKSLEDGSFNIDKLIKEEEKAKSEFLKAAKILSNLRQDAAKDLDKKVNRELPALKLEKALFKTQLEELPEEKWSQIGIDKVCFTVAMNSVEKFSQIHKTASGGELSRIMLALKVNLAQISPVPTVIFDEIDSGIGGAAASAVGSRLAKLSEELQILVVTHSPQVASLSDKHFRVDKKQNENNQINTLITELEEEAKLEEIARMLSGENITNEARAAAKALLK